MRRIHLPAPRPRDSSVEMPGDKSISHRALLCAAIARGVSTIGNLNVGADVHATAAALRALGVPVETDSGAEARVRGVDAFVDPPALLDCGNSGTTMRLLAGLLAGRANAVLDGDASLRRRPMERVAEPLRSMGADVTTADGGRPPLRVRRTAGELHGETVRMRAASAQVKSAVMLAGLHALGETTIEEPAPTRDHTERMLRARGADIAAADGRIRVRRSALRPLQGYRVPGDFSAAFFFIAAAATLPGSRVVLHDVGVNPTRVAALDAIRAMGADVRVGHARIVYGEPVADIDVRGGMDLHGIALDPSAVSNLIDEIPALCAVAASARGTFSVRGASELRVKESDRVETTAALLRSFGVDVEEFADGLAVRGGGSIHAPKRVATGGDHRIGMSAAVLAAAAGAPIQIDDAECIATSFPDFAATWSAAFSPA